jgi:hypothetical protein
MINNFIFFPAANEIEDARSYAALSGNTGPSRSCKTPIAIKSLYEP